MRRDQTGALIASDLQFFVAEIGQSEIIQISAKGSVGALLCIL
jgi:hypothetical protein